MNALVIIVGGLIVGTKVLDCWSTLFRIKTVDDEQNSLARFLMIKVGIGPAIGAILMVEVFVVLFAIWILFVYFDSKLWKSLFILTGLFVASVQLAVGYANYYGRQNLVTVVAGNLLRRFIR